MKNSNTPHMHGLTQKSNVFFGKDTLVEKV